MAKKKQVTRYYWLKMPEDFFQSKRIKRLRAMAGGDTYTIIYLKLQLKALKEDGYLYFDNIMDDFIDELALDIDEKPDDVRMTVNYLLTVGLMKSNESGDTLALPYLREVIGSESLSAQKMRRLREGRKQLGMSDSNNASQCDHNVTESDDIYSYNNSYSYNHNHNDSNNKMAISEGNDQVCEPTVEVVSEEDSRFETFWGLYPRRVKKPNARKAFDSKCKDEKTFNEIMHGLKKWCDSWVDIEPKYIPYPASWLNGEQWNDEPPRTKREEFAF